MIKQVLVNHLKRVGDITPSVLLKIKTQLMSDLLVIECLLSRNRLAGMTEETEERDRYYQVTENGKEVAEAETREDIVGKLLEGIHTGI